MYDTYNLSMPIYMKLLVHTNYKHIMHMNIRFADKKTELELLFVEFEKQTILIWKYWTMNLWQMSNLLI